MENELKNILKNYVRQYVNESNKFVVQQIVFDLIDSMRNDPRKEKKGEIVILDNCLMKLPRSSIINLLIPAIFTRANFSASFRYFSSSVSLLTLRFLIFAWPRDCDWDIKRVGISRLVIIFYCYRISFTRFVFVKQMGRNVVECRFG